MENSISRIGVCAGCQRMSKIMDHACDGCRKIFGPKAGHVFNKIRQEPEFAKKIYTNCSKKQKEKFAKMFGIPAGCETGLRLLSSC